MQVTTIIPARGGSKGVPRKNLREINGRPLIAHSVLHAVRASCVDYCVVSTDDEEIADTARACGADIVYRPADLSGDDASSESALIHALNYLEAERGMKPDIVVFLQCTSPLRRASDIDAAVQRLKETHADSLLSVSPTHRFLWEQSPSGPRSLNYDFRHRDRRQDLGEQFVENGSIYLFKPWVLEQTGNRLGGRIELYVMPEIASLEIDTESDFSLIEVLMANYYSDAGQ